MAIRKKLSRNNWILLGISIIVLLFIGQGTLFSTITPGKGTFTWHNQPWDYESLTNRVGGIYPTGIIDVENPEYINISSHANYHACGVVSGEYVTCKGWVILESEINLCDLSETSDFYNDSFMAIANLPGLKFLPCGILSGVYEALKADLVTKAGSDIQHDLEY